MKKIITVIVLILAIQLVYSSSFTNTSNDGSCDGILIKEIHVTKFPYGRNGNNFDKDSRPDLYFLFFDGNKKVGRSDIINDPLRGRIPLFSGGNMPFRMQKDHTYYLQLMDYDKDRRIRSNEDEKISSKISITVNGLISRYGKQRSYLITDPQYSDVTFILIVEHVSKSQSAGTSVYLKNVKSMDQLKVQPKNRVYEGCGPIAGAMIMGYWQTEMGYKIMNTLDHFNGTKHPTNTILEFRRKADTHAWGNSAQAATRKLKMVDALQYFVNQANLHSGKKTKLKVDMMWSIRRWPLQKAKLKKELREGSPVILLLKKEPPCLLGKWVNASKFTADHYIVAVGFDDAKKVFYVMPGWEEQDKSASSGPEAHAPQGRAHCRCSYNEIEEADPSLIWIKR